jgi:transcriptional regulator with XRE-family HTH domain
MESIDYKGIYQRIRLMLDNSSFTVVDLTKHLGKTRQLMYNWQNGKMNPTLPDLLKIANFFGVPLEYLISGKEGPIDDATAAFLVSTKDLTEEQKKIIFASIKAQVDMFKQLNKEKK